MNVAHRLIDTITYQVPSGLSSTGNPTWGGQLTTRARVEYKTKSVIGADGTRRESDAWMVTEIEIPNNARVWFPGASTADINQSRRPILSQLAYTLDGSYSFYQTFF